MAGKRKGSELFLQVPEGTSVREVEGGFMLTPSEGRPRKITFQELIEAWEEHGRDIDISTLGVEVTLDS